MLRFRSGVRTLTQLLGIRGERAVPLRLLGQASLSTLGAISVTVESAGRDEDEEGKKRVRGLDTNDVMQRIG